MRMRPRLGSRERSSTSHVVPTWAPVWGAKAVKLAGAMLAFGTIAFGTIAFSAPAHAASYRYWSYWWVDEGAWTFATAGPASSLPADGAVEGWRFGITGVAGSSKDAPSVDPSETFAKACGSTPRVEGRKRVAVVIDPGPPTVAPAGDQPGEPVLGCASIEVDANGYQVLRSLTQVRTENGLVCAISGYPSSGCAEIVPDELAEVANSTVSGGPSTPGAPSPGPSAIEPSAPTPEASPPSGPGPLPLIIGGLAIGAMLGYIWRRRRAP